MSNRKKGANNNDQNFIRRCVKDKVDWDVSRIAAHLLIEESIVQGFYDGYVKELDEGSEPDPPVKIEIPNDSDDDDNDDPDAVEEFDSVP